MADDALLSQLCSICNISPFKYKCPGCSAQTCSLPCYKRHQQWAQCSGKRDPTKFVKRSQLETPAGIDHDFNFLAGVERGLKRAEHVEQATSGSAPGLQRGANRRAISNQQLTAAGVEVIRAPQGLSRQKQNATHRGKTGHIIWSVEWIREGESHTFIECSEVETLQRLDPFRSSRKRKRIDATSSSTSTSTTTAPATTPSNHVPKSDEIKTETAIQAPDKPNEITPLPPPPQRGEEQPPLPLPDNVTPPQMAHPPHPRPLQHGPSPEPLPPVPTTSTSNSPQHTFYLLKPRTTTPLKVLIPLSPQTKLGDALRGRSVLEFPTVYVFDAADDASLPGHQNDGVFVLEDVYLQMEREKREELESVVKKGEHRLGEEQSVALEKQIDDKTILDVLKKDLGVLGKDL